MKNKVISEIHQQINLQKRYFAMYSTQNGNNKKKKIMTTEFIPKGKVSERLNGSIHNWH